MENLLDIKGYTFEENDSTDEQAEDDPNKKKLLTLKISSKIVGIMDLAVDLLLVNQSVYVAI